VSNTPKVGKYVAEPEGFWNKHGTSICCLILLTPIILSAIGYLLHYLFGT
jgi:hypothetical protein